MNTIKRTILYIMTAYMPQKFLENFDIKVKVS